MPIKGYKSLTVKDELYEKLEILRNDLKCSSINDVIAYLLRTYEDYTNALTIIMEKINEISREVKRFEVKA